MVHSARSSSLKEKEEQYRTLTWRRVYLVRKGNVQGNCFLQCGGCCLKDKVYHRGIRGTSRRHEEGQKRTEREGGEEKKKRGRRKEVVVLGEVGDF